MSYHFIDRKDPHIDVMFQGIGEIGEDAFGIGGNPENALQR